MSRTHADDIPIGTMLNFNFNGDIDGLFGD